jgi:hypothetical protein
MTVQELVKFDTHLNLAAWKTRYIDHGGFPDGLLPPHVHVALSSNYHHAYSNFSRPAPVGS